MSPILRFVAMSSNLILFAIVAVIVYHIGIESISSLETEELMVVALFFTGPILSQYLVWSSGSVNREESRLRQRIKNTRLKQELDKLEKIPPSI